MAKRLEYILIKMAIVSRLRGESIIIEDSRCYLSVSIGISLYRKDGIELEELIQKADSAMYRSKKTQKDYIIYKNC